MEGVHDVILDQCHFGLRSSDERGPGPAKKPTRFLTNLPLAGLVLGRRCKGCPRHVALVNSRARPAQKVPEKLSSEICYALKLQVESDREVAAVDAPRKAAAEEQEKESSSPGNGSGRAKGP